MTVGSLSRTYAPIFMAGLHCLQEQHPIIRFIKQRNYTTYNYGNVTIYIYIYIYISHMLGFSARHVINLLISEH